MISNFTASYYHQRESNSAYPPHSSAQADEEMPHQMIYKEGDTEEVASFLLSLKHRSVTPEPSLPSDDSLQQLSPGYQVYSFPPSHEQQQPQQQPCVDKTPALMMEEQQVAAGAISVEGLLNDSKLVLPNDRDLVPDALFVAMAQMRPCKLTQADRVGCYKTREIGFVGMSCLHCGGQPGFGRYYPNSVRSLAQTTTSQTILKHIGSKCRFCPPHIREAVNELQRQQAAREGMSSGRPRYGSRKIFFQRVWARLHGGPLADDDDQASKTSPATASLADDASSQTPSDLVSETNSRNTSPASSDDEDSGPSPVKISSKRGFGFLPTHKNLKRSFAAVSEPAAKRPRVFSS